MYEPREVPQEIADLPRYVAEELQFIANQFREMEIDHALLKTHHVAPSKPREGHVYRADGTDWNPGSGEGIYEYDGTTWNKL